MKIKYFIILSFLIISLTFLINDLSAQENIQYPVEELGNCKNETECHVYCDKLANINACLDFAKKNNLMSGEEISQARKFMAASDDAPGGCKNKNECDAYCNEIDHIDECIAFAEKNGLIPEEELREAKQVQSAIRRGVKPPPCGNKKQCDVYCEEADHMEECIAFAAEAGFIQGKELEDAQKMLQALKRGIKPPPCRGKDVCDEYCSSPENMEVCINFAMEAGFMSEEEKADAQKMLQAIKKGVKPPPCKGRDECDVYCGEEEHLEECMNFAVVAGFMSEEDAKMARKTGGKGPGDCKGKEECEAFCNNPENQEICFNFAKEKGLMSPEELQKMEEGKQQFRQTLEQMPQEALDCLKTEVGPEIVEKMKSGTVMPSRDIGNKMQGCFEKMGPPQGSSNSQDQEGFQPPERQGEFPPGGQTGPGGCATPEECQTYCQNNPEACQGFGPQSGPQQGQPCEGDNCQYGPMPGQENDFKPPEGEFKLPEQNQQLPAEIQQQYQEQYQQQLQQQMQLQQEQMQLQQEQMQLQQQLYQQQYQQPQEFQQPPEQTAPPVENAPPPPPPSAFFKADSFLGALLYPLAKALYNVR